MPNIDYNGDIVIVFRLGRSHEDAACFARFVHDVAAYFFPSISEAS
jgi:hypothetical protein